MIDRADHHEEVSLARTESREQGAEAVDIVRRHRERHILHGATSCGERIWKYGILTRPPDGFVEPCQDDGLCKELVGAIFGCHVAFHRLRIEANQRKINEPSSTEVDLMERKHQTQVAVIGSSDPLDPQTALLATEAGRLIAAKGAVLICGGLGGIMEAAARGAKDAGGLTVGILPDYRKESANPFIDVALPSGIGHARNVIVAASGDVVVAFPGSHGTRSEISIALKLGRPVIGVGDWINIPGVKQVSTIPELEKALLPFF